MHRWLLTGSTRRGMGPAFEAADVPDNAYHDGKDADHAIKTLNELRDQPFFLAVGFHKPHLPFNAPKHHWDVYDREALPLALNTSAPENVTEYSLTEFGELARLLWNAQGGADSRRPGTHIGPRLLRVCLVYGRAGRSRARRNRTARTQREHGCNPVG